MRISLQSQLTNFNCTEGRPYSWGCMGQWHTAPVWIHGLFSYVLIHTRLLGCETIVSCTCTKQCQKAGCEMVQNQSCTISQRTWTVPARTEYQVAIRCLCIFVQSCTNAMTHEVVRYERGIRPCLCVSAQYSASTDWHGKGAQLEMLAWGLHCGKSLHQSWVTKNSTTQRLHSL